MSSEIDNSGSTARDQLANERTFLAWTRTGLGLMGFGVVLAKWVEAGARTRIGGLAFVASGVFFLGYAFVRFHRVTRLLERGKFRSARTGPMVLIAFGIVVAVVAVFLILV